MASHDDAGLWAAPASQRSGQQDRFGLPPEPLAPWKQRPSRLAAWVGLGFLLSASLLLFPVGLLLLPMVVVAAAVLATRGPAWPEVTGLAVGASLFTGLVAYLNRDSRPCDGSGTVVVGPDDVREFSCGGTAPEPWLTLSVVLLLAAVSAYGVTAIRRRRRG